jgi:hypothetical protein
VSRKKAEERAMKRRTLGMMVGAGACAALLAWMGARGASPLRLHGPADASDKVATMADGGAVAAPPPAVAAPLPRARQAEDPLPAVKTEIGAALALEFRDSICGCETRACWLEASKAYRSSVGRAVPRSAEEGQIIDAALRETTACIKRIHAAESAVARED